MSTEQPKPRGEIADLLPISASSDVNGGRRRFTKTSLATSGVIMTLASRSVLACEAISPSGFCSVNQSRHGAVQISRCRVPSYWSSTTSWPIGNNTKFNAIFTQCGSNSPYYHVTCKALVDGKVAADSSKLGQYLVAAYLNALMGWSDVFLTASQCINMGNEYFRTGAFHPTANISWNSSQIVTYLQSTQS